MKKLLLIVFSASSIFAHAQNGHFTGDKEEWLIASKTFYLH